MLTQPPGHFRPNRFLFKRVVDADLTQSRLVSVALRQGPWRRVVVATVESDCRLVLPFPSLC
jgi:hypothetical protein